MNHTNTMNPGTTPTPASGCSRTTMNGKPAIYQNTKAILHTTYNIYQP